MDGAVSEPDAVDWNTGHAYLDASDEDDFSARLVLPEGLWEEKVGDRERPRPHTAPPAPAPDESGWDWVVVWGRER